MESKLSSAHTSDDFSSFVVTNAKLFKVSAENELGEEGIGGNVGTKSLRPSRSCIAQVFESGALSELAVKDEEEVQSSKAVNVVVASDR